MYFILILVLIVRAIMIMENRTARENARVRSVITRGPVVNRMVRVSFVNDAGMIVSTNMYMQVRKELLTMTANRTISIFITPCRGVIGGVIEDPPDQPDEDDDDQSDFNVD